MSFFRGQDPDPGNAVQSEAIAQVIVPRSVDLGDFTVHRALPSGQSRMVGPFIFFDHFGPAHFRSGSGIDVRPHPHIGLATLTYLFDGEIIHRDSLGTTIAIRPGEINWMTAGRGIVHSERTGPERRASGDDLHGLQCWVALPAATEETAPAFAHHGVGEFPVVRDGDTTVRVVVGSLYGAHSPVATASETVFADAMLRAGGALPLDAGHEERAIYVIDGEIDIGGDRFGRDRLLVFRPGDAVRMGGRPFRQGAGRRNRVHSAAGEVIASPSCPRLSRASTFFFRHLSKQDVDGRDKPGHDSGGLVQT